MKNKIICIVFVAVCLCICAVPSVCMTFARTDSTTENKRLKELPKLRTEEGGFNVNILGELGEYFGDHFAFRNAMVDADSRIQSGVFRVSNADTVVSGKNGWLYYSDTLNDYLGRRLLSDRAIFNIANNLKIVQDYAESRGAKFVFTVAPNKNSLYGDNMPYYYSCKAGSDKNITALAPKLRKAGVKYTDLFSVFGSTDETLYLKRDSHWNNKGAMLAFSAVMKDLDRDFTDYSVQEVTRRKTELGDLGRMLYPLSAEPEWNYYYNTDGYSYTTKTESVEDAYIMTSSKGSGRLLMYRDSFGNTLLPFFAGEFETACFSKAAPYAVEDDMNSLTPNCVVIEKVERNLDELASDPPLVSAVRVDKKIKYTSKKTDSTIDISESEVNGAYVTISGIADKNYVSDDTVFYVRLKNSDGTSFYRAFGISDENGDNGYLLYLPSDAAGSGAEIDVIAVSGSGAVSIISAAAQ